MPQKDYGRECMQFYSLSRIFTQCCVKVMGHLEVQLNGFTLMFLLSFRAMEKGFIPKQVK
jgi:hypothetical protein